MIHLLSTRWSACNPSIRIEFSGSMGMGVVAWNRSFATCSCHHGSFAGRTGDAALLFRQFLFLSLRAVRAKQSPLMSQLEIASATSGPRNDRLRRARMASARQLTGGGMRVLSGFFRKTLILTKMPQEIDLNRILV